MNDFKVNENKRISNILKLMRPEIKKDNVLSEIKQRPLMGHQIIDFWMLCAVNLFFSFKAHKNIWKLMVLFTSCVNFWLWCEFFAQNTFLGAPLNLFEFVFWSQPFPQRRTSQTKYYWSVCVTLWCTFCGGTHPGVFFNKCVQKTFGKFLKDSLWLSVFFSIVASSKNFLSNM